MEEIKTAFRTRIRNQVSNVILFGSMICVTAFGLVLGLLGGVTVLGRTGLHDLAPVLKLIIMLSATLGGFSAGIFTSLLISPLILRYAFFAKRVGVWQGVDVYRAADVDLPGRTANVFVSGFSFGIGPLKPTIFVAEGAARVLSRSALEAVFAHELSHLQCQHLLKRALHGVAAFLVASILTAITLIGMHWSGYSEIGGAFSLVAGIIPAALTWLTIRKLAWSQELEADAHALAVFAVKPESLIEALQTLQTAISRHSPMAVHPLVTERLNILRAKCAPASHAADLPRAA